MSQNLVSTNIKTGSMYSRDVLQNAVDAGFVILDDTKKEFSYKITGVGLELLKDFETLERKYDLSRFLFLKYGKII